MLRDIISHLPIKDTALVLHVAHPHQRTTNPGCWPWREPSSQRQLHHGYCSVSHVLEAQTMPIHYEDLTSGFMAVHHVKPVH
jgi:hypothetical protein